MPSPFRAAFVAVVSLLFSAAVASAVDAPISPLVFRDRADLEAQAMQRWRSDVALARPAVARDFVSGIHAASDARLIRAMGAKSYGEFVRRLGGGPRPDAAGFAASPLVVPVANITNDTTFVPINPCRILDTRLSPAGKFAAGETREFHSNFTSAGTTDWDAQGGDPSHCQQIPFDPQAVAITITAAAPQGPGNVKLWPLFAAEPTASSLNFTTVNLANTTIVANCVQCGADFNAKASAPTHLVGDVVGYFRLKDKTIDVDVTRQTLTGGATIGSVAGQAVTAVLLPGAGTSGISVNVTLPDDYSPNATLTGQFVFSPETTGCDITWAATGAFTEIIPIGPFSAGAITSSPSPVTFTVPATGNVFFALIDMNGFMNPGNTITMRFNRTADAVTDTCAGNLDLIAFKVTYE